MPLYRAERVPPADFMRKLRRVDPGLTCEYDSLSMRWDVLYKALSGPSDGQWQLVYRVCQRDHRHVDVGYEPLDDRVIRRLLQMDLARADISPAEYLRRVREAEAVTRAKAEVDYADACEQIIREDSSALKNLLNPWVGSTGRTYVDFERGT